MRLNLDELKRGLIRWFSDAPVSVLVGTADDVDQEQEWAEPLTDSTGSIPSIALRERVQFGLQMDWQGVPLTTVQIITERLRGEAMQTIVTSAMPPGPKVRLKHVPGFGIFHRLVIATNNADWHEDVAIVVGDVRVRLITGQVEAETVTAFDRVMPTETGYALEGGGEATETREGRFIEIITPGKSREDATLNAYATRGLVALLMGHHMTGEVVSSESYAATPQGQHGRVEIPVRAAIPRTLEDVELALVEQSLPHLIGSQRRHRALVLALRWFERGFTSEVILDRFLSFFIAAETVVNAFAADNSPIPVELEREALYADVLNRLRGEVDRDTIARVTNELRRSTMNDRFAFYVTSHGLKDELIASYRKLSRARSEAVHGNSIDVTFDNASEMRNLLLILLKTELQISSNLPWEIFPHIYTIGTEFEWTFDRDSG